MNEMEIDLFDATRAYADDHHPSTAPHQTLTLLATPDEVVLHPDPPIKLIGGPVPFLWIQYLSESSWQWRPETGKQTVHTWRRDYTLIWSGTQDKKGDDDDE